MSQTDVVRVVDDGDAVVDRYGPVARIELWRASWPSDAALAALVHRATTSPNPIEPTIVTWAGSSTPIEHVVAVLRTAGGQTTMRVLDGAPPAAHVVHEDGVRLLVRTADADAAGAGVFVDHRVGRAWVRALSRDGAVVLNLFAHAGAFGAAAVVGGAARVDHVDAARKCATWAAVNLALNGADPRQHRFIVDDAVAFVKRAAKRPEPAYDVVVCDPPTTALRPDGSRFHVEKDLAALAADCVRSLKPGGALLLSTNDRALSVDDVSGVALKAAEGAGREICCGGGIDVVAKPPGIVTESMRGVVLRVA